MDKLGIEWIIKYTLEESRDRPSCCIPSRVTLQFNDFLSSFHTSASTSEWSSSKLRGVILLKVNTTWSFGNSPKSDIEEGFDCPHLGCYLH